MFNLDGGKFTPGINSILKMIFTGVPNLGCSFLPGEGFDNPPKPLEVLRKFTQGIISLLNPVVVLPRGGNFLYFQDQSTTLFKFSPGGIILLKE